MIKLIVTDMDGSLLDDDKNLPVGFMDTLEELRRRGVHFVVASGRSYVSLQHYFSHMEHPPVCICDNGGCMVYRGEVVRARLLPEQKVQKILALRWRLPGLRMTLCCENGTFYESAGPVHDERMHFFYPNATAVEDLEQVRDRAYKIGMSDELEPEKNSMPVLHEMFGDSLSFAMSGERWVDIADAGVCKGEAVALLQRHWGISREETMAFGDHFNDLSLLERAHYGYAMENAVPTLLAAARYTAPSNQVGGVQQVICQRVLQTGAVRSVAAGGE